MNEIWEAEGIVGGVRDVDYGGGRYVNMAALDTQDGKREGEVWENGEAVM